MKIAVVLRQVPDLIEPLEIAVGGKALDLELATFLVNETDDHALEQAILLKESAGGDVTVVAIDYGDIDNTLFTAAARGADHIVKIQLDDDTQPQPETMSIALATALKDIGPDLVLLGSQTHDELLGPLGPSIAHHLGLPYIGVVCGVEPFGGGMLKVFKEFPGAAKAALDVKTPAVLGVLAAEQPPRYVPVSRIRAAAKSAQFDEQEFDPPPVDALTAVTELYAPEPAECAEMIEGDEEEVASRVAGILAERGLVK